jgi:hypothetical protein
MAINYFGEARMKQLLTLIKGQLDLKATPAQIAQAIEDANLSQYALEVDLTALEEKVGEIPEGYTEENIVAYINKKAEETLNAASGGSSESAASVLAALNTYKAENDPKVTANTNAIAVLNGDATTDGSVAKQVADEATARSEADTALDNRIKAIEDDHLTSDDKTELQTAIADAVKAHDESDAAHAALFKALNDKDAAMQGEIDALEEKIGEVPADKTVVQMISDAQTAATYDDTQVKADIATNAEAIRVEKERMDAFMTLEDGETLNAALDSLKEIQDFITNEAADADILLGKVSALEAIVAGIGGEGEPATVVAYVTAAIEALKIGDYAKAADLTALADRVAAMEAKVPTWDAAEQNAKDYADGLNTAMDTRMQAVEGAKHTHDNKAVLDGITAEMVAAWNEADVEYTEAEVTAMWNEVFGA